MKNKLIRTISPITLAIVSAFDAATVGYVIFAIQKFKTGYDGWTIVFGIIMVFALLLGVFLTLDVIKTGVVFREDELEFNSVDENNVFKYTDIENVETSRDEKASLRKNFVDRYSMVIIHLKDGSVVTVELGLTTGKKLTKIRTEIENRIKSSTAGLESCRFSIIFLIFFICNKCAKKRDKFSRFCLIFCFHIF